MSPLDSSAILLQGVRGVLRPALQVGRGLSAPPSVSSFPGPRPSPSTPAPPSAFPPPSSPRAAAAFRSLYSPQATIRQAEMLIQLTASAAPSPALRQIVAAAYQMEVDARRELAQIRIQGMTPGREWFA